MFTHIDIYVLFVICMLTLLASPVSAAPTIFYGEDFAGTQARPNSTLARLRFMQQLSNATTESFETIPIGATAPLNLSLGTAGAASLSGAGFVNTASASSPYAGRYPSTGQRYWEVSGPFTIRALL